MKLFNLILYTGIVPDSWAIGVIKPIYKHKSDPKAPENTASAHYSVKLLRKAVYINYKQPAKQVFRRT